MRISTFFAATLTAVLLAACGGGGGNPGSSSSGSSSTSTVTGTTTVATRLAVQVRDASGQSVQSIPMAGGEIAATLTDSDGAALPNKLVTIDQGSSSLANFPNGASASTDSNGVAHIQVNRTTPTKFGSGTFTASYTAPSSSSSSSSASTSSSCTTTAPCLLSSTNSVSFRADPPAFKLALLDGSSAATSTIASS
ncbi:MAG: hypothetical protein ACR2I0_11410, partial [Rhodoferax sp.]